MAKKTKIYKLDNENSKQSNKVIIQFLVGILVYALVLMIANALLKPVLGSYESRKASWPLVILQIIATFFAISIGLMKSLFEKSYLVHNCPNYSAKLQQPK